MKKMLLLVLCVGLVPMFAADARADVHQALTAPKAPELRTTAERMIRVCPTPEYAIKPTPTRTSRQEDTLYYDAMTNVNSIGMNTTGYHWGAAVRFTTTELAPYAGYDLIAVVVYRAAYTTTNDSIIVYGQGTPTLPGPVASAQTWTPIISTWNRIDLMTPVPVNGTDDIWIADMHTESPGGWPSGCGPGPYVVGKGDWVCDSGAWYELGPLGLDYNWNIWAIVEPAGGPAAFWDFETGWQGWTHTSAQTFPAAWGVVTTSYPGGPYWTYVPPPDAGDSAFIIDSDATGSGTWVNDTAMSPVVANPGYNFLKWGFYLQYDDLAVLLREYDGGWGSWNVVASYSGTTGPSWDSVDVSSYTGDSLQVAFQYDDGNSWLYGATFDNVGFYVPADHDAGTSDIAAPAATILPGSNIDPIATYKNYGGAQETFDCYFVIDSAGTNLYNQTTSVTVDPGADTTITWPTWTAGPDGVTYDVMAYTVLTGDQNPSNDTMAMTSTTSSWLYWDDGAPANAWVWTVGGSGWGVQFVAPGDVYVDSFAVYIWDASWPVPGSNLSSFRIFDGATEPTTLRQEWIDATIVRGAWNKFPTDSLLNIFNAGENIYMFWIQTADNPNTPGLACDAAIDMGAYQWWWRQDLGTYGTGALSGDWLIRVHIVPYVGISEWIDYTPDVLSMSVAGISRNSIAIRFTLPHTGMTNLILYDATGRRLETLVSNTLNAGTHQYTTDLDLAAGVYFVTLTTEDRTITKKSLIVK